jgi:amino-acid N-acetyltransferase
VTRRKRGAAIRLREGTTADAPVLHRLITDHVETERLLPRTAEEIAVHASRFVVATARGRIVACAELAPLSHEIAEVRSLVVVERRRGSGVGTLVVEELKRRARADGFSRLCAFTHAPAYFVRVGFSMVPHVWLPEKIAVDCRGCHWFRRCGQYAMLLPLDYERGLPLDDGQGWAARAGAPAAAAFA